MVRLLILPLLQRQASRGLHRPSDSPLLTSSRAKLVPSVNQLHLVVRVEHLALNPFPSFGRDRVGQVPVLTLLRLPAGHGSKQSIWPFNHAHIVHSKDPIDEKGAHSLDPPLSLQPPNTDVRDLHGFAFPFLFSGNEKRISSERQGIPPNKRVFGEIFLGAHLSPAG